MLAGPEFTRPEPRSARRARLPSKKRGLTAVVGPGGRTGRARDHLTARFSLAPSAHGPLIIHLAVPIRPVALPLLAAVLHTGSLPGLQAAACGRTWPAALPILIALHPWNCVLNSVGETAPLPLLVLLSALAPALAALLVSALLARLATPLLTPPLASLLSTLPASPFAATVLLALSALLSPLPTGLSATSLLASALLLAEVLSLSFPELLRASSLMLALPTAVLLATILLAALLSSAPSRGSLAPLPAAGVTPAPAPLLTLVAPHSGDGVLNPIGDVALVAPAALPALSLLSTLLGSRLAAEVLAVSLAELLRAATLVPSSMTGSLVAAL